MSKEHCHHNENNKPNHLCPFAIQQAEDDKRKRKYVDTFTCATCSHRIEVMTPVDSDRQHLTELQIVRGERI